VAPFFLDHPVHIVQRVKDITGGFRPKTATLMKLWNVL